MLTFCGEFREQLANVLYVFEPPLRLFIGAKVVGFLEYTKHKAG